MTDSLHILAFMMGPFEWTVVLVVAVLIFGRRLPEIAKGVGKSLTEFKKGVKEAQNEVTTVAKDIDESSEPKQQEEIKEQKVDDNE